MSGPQSMPNSSAEEAVDFGAYPQDYSSEQEVKVGYFVVVHGDVKGGSQLLLNGLLQSRAK